MTSTPSQSIHNRDDKLARLGIVKLADWLKSSAPSQAGSIRILDYGCGYFDLGSMLQNDSHIHIDGYEPDSGSLQNAHKRAPTAKICGLIAQLPTNTYDLIVMNSVLQYFKGGDEFTEFLNCCSKLLAKQSHQQQVIITDIIPRRYRKLRDVLFNLWLAWRHQALVNMLLHLVHVARSSTHVSYYQLEFGELAKLAAAAGYHATKLADNIGPSRYRYTVVLSRIKPASNFRESEK